MTKHKSKSEKLPDRILPIPCKDKGFQEEWIQGRNLLNIPHSFRAVICGRPGMGKSTLAKNLLLRQDPMFEEVYVIHVDHEFTEEYDDIEGAVMLNYIPKVNDKIFNSKKKRLLILDDLEYKFMNKDDKRNMDRLYGYCASHKSTSMICTAQCPFSINPTIRRMSDIWIIGRINNDLSAFALLASRCGMKRENFEYVFDKYIHGIHDTFWVDLTKGTPAKYRINGYTVLDEKTFEPINNDKNINNNIEETKDE